MNKFPPISRWCPHGDRQKEFAIFHPLSPSGIRWTTERRQETFRIARERFDWSHPFRRRPHFEFFFSYSDASSHQWQTGEGDLMTPIYNVERLINFNWWNYSEINLALLSKAVRPKKASMELHSVGAWNPKGRIIVSGECVDHRLFSGTEQWQPRRRPGLWFIDLWIGVMKEEQDHVFVLFTLYKTLL